MTESDLWLLGIGPKCIYCGKAHEVSCDEIKSVEYRADGSVKVELMTPNDYPQTVVGQFGEQEIKFFEGR